MSHSGGHSSDLEGGEGVAVYSVSERVFRVGVFAPLGSWSPIAVSVG